MINLLSISVDVPGAKKAHVEFLRYYVQCRLGKNPVNTHGYITHIPLRRSVYSTPARYNEFVDFLDHNDNINRILEGDPHTLEAVQRDFVGLVNRLFGANAHETYLKTSPKKRDAHMKHFFQDVVSVFNYKFFSDLEPTEDYSIYHLTEKLNVRACIYCNRTYTITRKSKSKGKLMRPQLDHWYPKAIYPLLSISFFNLIPSCSYCNSSVKGVVELDLIQHIHPYVLESTLDQFHFGYRYDTSLKQYDIFLTRPKGASDKAFRTLRKLKIDQMYNAHHSELKDLINLKKAYSDKYIEKMAQFFPDTGLSKQETYRILFGAELDEENFHRMPFSKFKHDILTSLGIIKNNM